MERLYTCEDVAECVGMNVQTVRRMCRDGDIAARKFGSVWRIPASAVEFGREKEEAPRDGNGRLETDSERSADIVRHSRRGGKEGEGL
jgi:excisionase family DNA binding protein